MRAGLSPAPGLTSATEGYGNTLAGVEPYPRWALSSQNYQVASGRMSLCYMTPPVARTASTMVIAVGATTAAATPTICRLGVFSIAANGNGTLVASTPNDNTLFGAASQYLEVTKALSASYTYVAGQRYAHGVLVVSAVACPSFFQGPTNFMDNFYARAPRLNGDITGLADLPATFTAGQVSLSGQLIWIGAV